MIRLLAIFSSLLLSASLISASDTRFYLSSWNLRPGETLKVTFVTPKPVQQGTVIFNKRPYSVFFRKRVNDQYSYVTYIGIPHWQSPRLYAMKLFLKFQDHSRYSSTIKVKVNAGRFKTESLSFSPSKTRTLKGKKGEKGYYATLRDEARAIGTAFRVVSRKKRFDRPFILPVEGRISSPFGSSRKYNGKTRWTHKGVDIAQKPGTPVKSSNAGKVVLSQRFRIHGNTVMIDHGLGIISIYTHLQSRAVTLGDQVRRGQIIGKVGSTGQSTGPHLHWGLSIQNTRVDPLFWAKNALMTR